MTELQKYYNTILLSNGMPEFENLSQGQISDIENSFHFTLFRLGLAIEDFKRAFKEEVINPFFSLFRN
jgi:hypothetical protein